MDVLCDPLCAMIIGIRTECLTIFRIHRREVFEERRDFDHRLVDHDCDRIQIRRNSFQPEALRFERDGATTSERIEQRRHFVVPPTDFCARLFQHLFVVHILPFHELANDVKQPLTLRFLLRLCRKEFWM